MTIPDSDITVNTIDNYIERFDFEYGVYDDVLVRVFDNADNDNYDNVFCRVGLLDLLYRTGIQRFNKGGIDAVTRHIMRLHKKIDATKTADTIDYNLYGKLEEIEYKDVVSMRGRENSVPVFASKFLSFTNPKVYPIMDSIAKRVLGVRNGATYYEYCERMSKFVNDKIKPLEKQYSVKEIDKFLWLYGKKNGKRVLLGNRIGT